MTATREGDYRPEQTFVMGLDLGQANDYTALAVIQQATAPVFDADGALCITAQGQAQVMDAWRLVHLDRWRGESYPALVRRIQGVRRRPPLTPQVPLVIDHTGVGRAIGDMFIDAEAAAPPWAVTITGGHAVSRTGQDIHVPKLTLISTLVAVHQNGRLQAVEGLPLWPALVEELLNFKPTMNERTGNVGFEAWRATVHDDLVLALALAVWFAENQPPGIEPLDPQIVNFIAHGWESALGYGSSYGFGK